MGWGEAEDAERGGECHGIERVRAEEKVGVLEMEGGEIHRVAV